MKFSLRLIASALLLLLMPLATADVTTATQAMENPSNPLLLMRTSRGEVFLELFPESAPRNVANFIALAQARVPLFDVTTGSMVQPNYYDGMTFHRVLKNYLIQAGAPRQAGAPVPEYQLEDEIDSSACMSSRYSTPLANRIPGLICRITRIFSARCSYLSIVASTSAPPRHWRRGSLLSTAACRR